MERKVPVPPIHVITTDALLSVEEATDAMRQLGEIGALHLRSRTATSKQVYDLAVQLAPLQQSTGCMLVINERVDVALAAGAKGVQLPSDSINPEDVRQIAPDLMIGISTHPGSNDEFFLIPEPAPFDWIFAGNLFETSSHPGRPGFGLELLGTLVKHLRTPVIAIGGIKPEHLPPILTAGTEGIGIVSGFKMLRHYISAYEQHRGGQGSGGSGEGGVYRGGTSQRYPS